MGKAGKKDKYNSHHRVTEAQSFLNLKEDFIFKPCV